MYRWYIYVICIVNIVILFLVFKNLDFKDLDSSL